MSIPLFQSAVETKTKAKEKYTEDNYKKLERSHVSPPSEYRQPHTIAVLAPDIFLPANQVMFVCLLCECGYKNPGAIGGDIPGFPLPGFVVAIDAGLIWRFHQNATAMLS